MAKVSTRFLCLSGREVSIPLRDFAALAVEEVRG
jgi:hypothetical protein